MNQPTLVLALALALGLPALALAQSPCGNGNPTDLCDGGPADSTGWIINTGGSSSTSNSEAYAASGAYSGTEVSNHVDAGDLTYSHTEDHDYGRMPGTPAPSYGGLCASGAAAGFAGGSASLGTGSEFCEWLALAELANTFGKRTEAEAYLAQAESTLRRQRFVSRFFDWIPVVGRLF